MIAFQFNGKTWFYDNSCEFIIELGRYTGSYQINKRFNNIDNALAYYAAYQVSNGYKKRLSMICGNTNRKTVLGFYLTQREGLKNNG